MSIDDPVEATKKLYPKPTYQEHLSDLTSQIAVALLPRPFNVAAVIRSHFSRLKTEERIEALFAALANTLEKHKGDLQQLKSEMVSPVG